jgi:iron-sulfur cluster repair protein YtfE (RIC family)
MTGDNTIDIQPLERACAPEWSQRSLTQIIAHILEWYSTPIERLLEKLPHTTAALPTDSAAKKVLQDRVGEIFYSVQDIVETHMLLEGNALFPVLIAAEYPDLMLIRRTGKELSDLLDRVGAEHKLIGRLVYDLEEAVRPIVSLPLLHRPMVLSWTLDMTRLAQLIKQQVAFEDRCILPRATQIFRRLP